MHGRGCVWQGGHVWPGGIHGQGVGMARGHVWLGGMCGGDVHGQGACMAGGVCVVGGMHGQEGVCMAWGVCVTCTLTPGRYYDYGIRSMSGRYASYWNAILLGVVVTCTKL